MAETLFDTGPESAAIEYAIRLLRQGVLSIDEEGRIWRHAELDRWGNVKAIESRRAENVGSKGYLRLSLKLPAPGRLVCVQAHRVVWIWLRGPIPDGLQINHKDLNKANNHPDNLEPIDGAGNIQHSYANGRTIPWSRKRTLKEGREWRPGRPLLSDTAKQQVLSMRAEGQTYKDIEKATGISQAHIGRIVKGNA